ncbi:BREX-2 system adenine-specific DNA-methyltransferase PglX [Phormidesmis priestleyi]
MYKETCYRQYSLAVPFMQRIYSLAVAGGFTGQITANSFMKREFGKKLIENFIPNVDLTHVIDTSGAYIPGHGTPTVILFGRNRKPIVSTIRAVMGIRGEPSTPENPANGLVWSAILNQVDHSGSQSEFVSVTDSARVSFCKHPWSIGGGGASDLKEWLEKNSDQPLLNLIEPPIGRAVRIGEEEVFIFNSTRKNNSLCSTSEFRGYLIGENLRDWALEVDTWVWYPYSGLGKNSDMVQQLWSWRTALANRSTFQGLMADAGLAWFDYMQHTASAYKTPLSIAFAEVATHNHFVLDRGGKVFKQTAPVIKLSADATEDDYLVLLGLLNSSIACFWLKQVCFPKKGFSDAKWEERMAFNSSNIENFPLPLETPLLRSRELDQLSLKLTALSPVQNLNSDQDSWLHTLKQMITLQEELDWQCYQLYGLIDEDLTYAAKISPHPPTPSPWGEGEPDLAPPSPWGEGGWEGEGLPPIALGQRAFEIVMARKMAAGELQTTWFDRHHSTPITDFPIEWSDDYKQLVQRRIDVIERDRNIALIEQPEYKRRWNTEPWNSQLERALRNWLLDRLETYFDFDGRMNDESKPTAKLEISLVSIAQLADLARQDPKFLQIGELYRNDPTFNVQKLVTELVEAESVPLLPILRYKPTGLRKRTEWEHTWHLQRREDKIDDRTKLDKDHPDYLPELSTKALKQQEIGDIPVPPKYTNTDFQKSHYWKLRGKLDVPKERWVSFPHCNAEDGTLTIAWAGYNHLQLAQAISAYFVEVQERLGGREDPRLPPLLANLLQLLPWLKQWHNDLDPTYNLAMGDYFEAFIQDEARQIDQTLDDIRSWHPPTKTNRRRS